MDQFYTDLAKAAKWMWQNRSKPQYWEWQDLTKRNPDETNLGLSDADAWNIFTVFEAKGLIHEFAFEKDGKERKGFKIDLSDPKAWKEIQKEPKWWRNWITRPVCSFVTKFWLFIVWAISVGLAASLTHVIKKWIDHQYPTGG